MRSEHRICGEFWPQIVLILVLRRQTVLVLERDDDGIGDESHGRLKQVLKRIVSILTRLIARGEMVREDSAEYNADGEYEYRDAEYEYEIQTKTQ